MIYMNIYIYDAYAVRTVDLLWKFSCPSVIDQSGLLMHIFHVLDGGIHP